MTMYASMYKVCMTNFVFESVLFDFYSRLGLPSCTTSGSRITVKMLTDYKIIIQGRVYTTRKTVQF